jgi:hypothetical protein
MLSQPVRFEPRRGARTSRNLVECLSRAKERGGGVKGTAPSRYRAADSPMPIDHPRFLALWFVI